MMWPVPVSFLFKSDSQSILLLTSDCLLAIANDQHECTLSFHFSPSCLALIFWEEMNPDSLCSEDALDPPAPLLKCCITGLCHHIRFPTLTSIRRSAQEWGCWSGLILRLILWGTPYCFHTAAHWRPCQQYTGVSLSSSFPGLFSVLWL